MQVSWTQVLLLLILLIITGYAGYIAAQNMKAPQQIPQQVPADAVDTSVPVISKQYGTGITALPSNNTAKNYQAPTQWARVGIIKTVDPNDDTFYPLYERRISSSYEIFEYAFMMVDRNNFIVPLNINKFLEDKTELGVLRGLESKGPWVVDRFQGVNWAYMQ